MTTAPATYTVQQLATLSGVSVRTLHHYDTIGLLRPARAANGHRVYRESELLRLQQILLYRAIDVPLASIGEILDDPSFDTATALRSHRAAIERQHRQLLGLIATIDATIARLDGRGGASDADLFAAFWHDHVRTHAAEAKQRWGDTAAYKQSQERTAHMTKDDFARIAREGDVLLQRIAACIDEGPTSNTAQALIAIHYANLRVFYDPTPTLYRGLADLYVQDPRFRAHHARFDARLPEFMRDAMLAFCNADEQE